MDVTVEGALSRKLMVLPQEEVAILDTTVPPVPIESAKSETAPVVDPDWPRTEIVQARSSPMSTLVVPLLVPTQLSVDADVGTPNRLRDDGDPDRL